MQPKEITLKETEHYKLTADSLNDGQPLTLTIERKTWLWGDMRLTLPTMKLAHDAEHGAIIAVISYKSESNLNMEQLRQHIEMLEEVNGELAELNEWLSKYVG